jgi:hypothetical protein
VFLWHVKLALLLETRACVALAQGLEGRPMLGELLRDTLLGGTREEPGTLIQGAPVFPGSSRLGIEPKTAGWLVQDPTTSPSGDLIPTIRGSGAHPGRG